MAPEVFNLAQAPITSHAFSADHSRKLTYMLLCYLGNRITEVAVSLNTNDVQIYSRQGPDWVVTEALSEVCIYTFDCI